MATVASPVHPFEAARTGGSRAVQGEDLSLAEFGRNEIRLAEHEMPGLMALRSATRGRSRSPARRSWAPCT